jgi:hypothetical protein
LATQGGGVKDGGDDMQTMRKGYRGLSIFMGLNIDRLLTVSVILLAILVASWIQGV